jgi:hypothetical protein
VNETDSEPCPLAGSGISGTDTLDGASRELEYA